MTAVIVVAALTPEPGQKLKSRPKNVFVVQRDSGANRVFIPPPPDASTRFFFSQHPSFPLHCSQLEGGADVAICSQELHHKVEVIAVNEPARSEPSAGLRGLIHAALHLAFLRLHLSTAAAALVQGFTGWQRNSLSVQWGPPSQPIRRPPAPCHTLPFQAQ